MNKISMTGRHLFWTSIWLIWIVVCNDLLSLKKLVTHNCTKIWYDKIRYRSLCFWIWTSPTESSPHSVPSRRHVFTRWFTSKCFSWILYCTLVVPKYPCTCNLKRHAGHDHSRAINPMSSHWMRCDPMGWTEKLDGTKHRKASWRTW